MCGSIFGSPLFTETAISTKATRVDPPGVWEEVKSSPCLSQSIPNLSFLSGRSKMPLKRNGVAGLKNDKATLRSFVKNRKYREQSGLVQSTLATMHFLSSRLLFLGEEEGWDCYSGAEPPSL